MCSLSTRGFWFEILGAMHELGRSGQITGTVPQLARVGRCTAAEAEEAIAELKLTKAAEVSERNGVYTLINRRMKGEFDAREANKKYVSNHRKNQNVRFGKTDVRNSETPVNTGVDDENQECKANVRLHSSSSSSNNLHSSSRNTSTPSRGKPPPDTASAAPTDSGKETKTKEKRLDDLQEQYPLLDVRAVRKKYLDHCERNGNQANWKIFEIWLKHESEPMAKDADAPAEDAAVKRRQAIADCALCDANGYIKIGDGVRMCRHSSEKTEVKN